MKKNYIRPIVEVVVLNTENLMEFTQSSNEAEGCDNVTFGSKGYDGDDWDEE